MIKGPGELGIELCEYCDVEDKEHCRNEDGDKCEDAYKNYLEEIEC